MKQVRPALRRLVSRPRLRAAALVALALLLSAGLRPASARGRASVLEAALAAVLDRSGVAADRVGVAVLERRTRTPAFLRGHTRALPTASTAKVLTAAAALDLLGPGHVFSTRLTRRGAADASGVLAGDLVVHGSGDPNISGRAFGGDETHVLDVFAKAVARAGIRRVAGCLVLDDGCFDREYHHPSWSRADRARWYGAPVGGLSFNDSCVDLVVRGTGRAGGPAAIEAPSTTGPWRLANRVEVAPGGATVVHASWTGDVLSVSGRLPPGATYSFSAPVREPVLFLGGALLARLERAGVVVEGGLRLARDEGDRREGALLAEHASALGPTLRVMNKRSQNFYAAALFKACGATLEGRGTWESGSRAVETVLRRRGISDEGRTVVVDGCGLAIANRATAATLALLLADLEEDLLRGPLLLESLAVPGEEGTLDDRLRTNGLERRLRAKTGTLGNSGVHSLAGYLDGKGDEPGWVFAILVRDGRGRALIDGLVAELARR